MWVKDKHFFYLLTIAQLMDITKIWLVFRLHRMQEMQAIVTDLHCIYLPVSLSVTWLKSAAARAVYAACRVHEVIQCSLRQMPLDSCLYSKTSVCICA